MKQATIQLDTLTCPSCVLKIESAVKNLAGVDKDSLKVLFNASKVKVDFDQEKLSVQDLFPPSCKDYLCEREPGRGGKNKEEIQKNDSIKASGIP